MVYYFKIMTVVMPFVSFGVIDFISEIIGRIIHLSGNWRIRAISENLYSIGASNFNTKNTYVNMVKNHFEILKFYRMKNQYIQKITEAEKDKSNSDYTKNAFILTGHFGNWEIASYYISSVGVKPCTVAEFVNVGEEMYSIMEMLRIKSGMIVFPLEDLTTPIKLRDSYRAGRVPILLVDRDITRAGIPINVGRRILNVPKGAFYLANKLNAEIIAGAYVRIKSKKYRFKVILNNVGKSESTEEGAKKTIEALFNLIRDYPEQWFAFDLNWEK